MLHVELINVFPPLEMEIDGEWVREKEKKSGELIWCWLIIDCGISKRNQTSRLFSHSRKYVWFFHCYAASAAAAACLQFIYFFSLIQHLLKHSNAPSTREMCCVEMWGESERETSWDVIFNYLQLLEFFFLLRLRFLRFGHLLDDGSFDDSIGVVNLSVFYLFYFLLLHLLIFKLLID